MMAVCTSFAPGTQWSHIPMVRLLAALARRTRGADRLAQAALDPITNLRRATARLAIVSSQLVVTSECIHTFSVAGAANRTASDLDLEFGGQFLAFRSGPSAEGFASGDVVRQPSWSWTVAAWFSDVVSMAPSPSDGVRLPRAGGA